MKVGLFTYGMKDQLTGIGQYAMHLSYALKAQYPDIQIILLNPYPHSPLKWYRDFPVIPMPRLALLPGVIIAGSVALATTARRYHLDIIHDPCGIAPFAFPGRYRRVVTIHDAIPYIYPQYYPLLGKVVYRTTVPLARWTADAVLTVSESAKDDLMRYAQISRSHIVVTPLGTRLPTPKALQIWRQDLPNIQKTFGVSGPYFLVVGANHPRKNVTRVIEALRLMRQSGELVELIVTGQPPQGTGRIAEPGLQFVGHVNDETLHRLYANATGVLVPSYYEGFGLPALEAMAHGTPVIASPVSSLPEIIQDTGLYASPSDTLAWVGAMRRLLSDTALRQHLAGAGYHRASQYSWAQTAKETVWVYRRIMKGQAS